jgi:hypothetical protein
MYRFKKNLAHCRTVADADRLWWWYCSYNYRNPKLRAMHIVTRWLQTIKPAINATNSLNQGKNT